MLGQIRTRGQLKARTRGLRFRILTYGTLFVDSLFVVVPIHSASGLTNRSTNCAIQPAARETDENDRALTREPTFI